MALEKRFREGIKEMASKGRSLPLGGFCIFEGILMREEPVIGNLSAILGACVEDYSHSRGEEMRSISREGHIEADDIYLENKLKRGKL
jgi:hypothetical protein